MIDAIYFDGENSRRNPVTLIIYKRVLAMRGEGIRLSVRLSQVKISERLQHAPRLVHLKNGGVIEITDPAFDKMLRANHYREPRVVQWQQNWPLSLAAMVLLVVTLASGYHWGLPWAADKLAQYAPASLGRQLGDQSMAFLDGRLMQPSALDVVEQARVQRLFAEMRQPPGKKSGYRLEFRSSRLGPNAFALPNGVIVMTDELVQLAGDDEAVLGVLAHELGHVRHRHSLRNILQTLGVGIVINVLVGDVSGILAAAPTFLLEQKYSRDFEREADQFAIDMMQINRKPLSPMAALFEKMSDPAAVAVAKRRSGQVNDGEATSSAKDGMQEPAPPSRRKSGTRGDRPTDYFSSHPSTAERLEKLRAADRR